MKERKIILAVPVLVAIIIFIAYLYSWDIGAHFHPDQTTNDMAELTKMVSDQIDEGKKSGDFYLKDITLEEIEEINDYICSLNGTVEQFYILGRSKHGYKIRFEYEISDNYYAFQKYKNNIDIPSDRPAALKLYEEVNNVIKKIIKPGMTDYEKELAIHDYIVQNCEYGYSETSNDYAFRAYGVLIQGKAVCNGYAEAMALLLDCADVENEIMTGWASGELHAWNRVKIDEKWYQVDTTWDDPIPDRKNIIGHMFFNVTDDIMDDTHKWNKQDYEVCEDMKYNFFEYNNSIGNYDSLKNKMNFMTARDPYATFEYVVTDYSGNYDMSNLADTSFSYTFDTYGPYNILTISLGR